jgi:methyl-galactoside transport system ATP-binding protein
MSLGNQESHEYVLEMNHITKQFPGVKALDDVCLKVRPGTVHSLMGENGAGKSTLMKCLFGIYSLDSGEIILDGNKVNFSNPAEALENHVSMVHQELNQVLYQSVMENVWLGRYPMKNGLIDEKKMYQDTKKIFDNLNIDVDPRKKVGTLQVSQKQMIEIAKAVSYDARVIVMDEPTSSLTEKEVEHLFRIIEKLKRNNTAIIYISHKMEEILRISDDVTVMRDGKWISTKPAGELTIDCIIKMMVGRELTERYPKKTTVPGEVLMEVQDLSTLSPAFRDVNFKLRCGEILGIAGLVGSKRTEVLETLFGIRQKGTGKISVSGREVHNKSPLAAMKNGFAMLTEERRSDGIFAGLSITFNMIIANLNSYIRKGILSSSSINEDVDKMIKAMNIKAPSKKTRINNLSGGNQQKVILGRWLLTQPQVLLLDEPTRGIDVGAKYEIYQLMNKLAAEGKGIIVVSSEMPELLGICDRILVMSNGHQSGIFDAKDVTQVQIMEASAKYI